MAAAASSGTTGSNQTKKARLSVGGRRRKKPVRLAPLTGRDMEVEVGAKSVQAPYEPGAYETVPFNRRVDLLEDELSHKRISVSQYEVGRQVQAVFERASGARLGSGGWNQGGSRDQTIAHELAIIYAIDDARLIRKLADRITRALGQIDARLLRRLLAERMTFAEAAALQGKSGDRGARYVALRFRDALEALDDAFAARGLTRFDEDGERRIQAERAEPSFEETDEQGIVVPNGHGRTWGSDQLRYGAEMNDEAYSLARSGSSLRDRVAARHRMQRRS